MSSRQDCELIELVSLSLSTLFLLPFASANLLVSWSKFSYRACIPPLRYSSSFYSQRNHRSIDRSIDRSKPFFFFFFPSYSEIHSRPKLSTSLTTSGEASDIRLTRSATVTGNPSVFTLHGGFLDRANAEGNRRHVNDVDEQKFERSQLECSPMREFPAAGGAFVASSFFFRPPPLPQISMIARPTFVPTILVDSLITLTSPISAAFPSLSGGKTIRSPPPEKRRTRDRTTATDITNAFPSHSPHPGSQLPVLATRIPRVVHYAVAVLWCTGIEGFAPIRKRTYRFAMWNLEIKPFLVGMKNFPSWPR